MIEETNPEKAPSPEAQQVDQEQVLSDVETVTVETNCQTFFTLFVVCKFVFVMDIGEIVLT